MRAVQQSISDFSNAAGAAALAPCTVEAWRPLPPQVADITCLSRVGYTIPPHAFEWLGVTLVLSRVIVQRESRGSIDVAAGTIMVVPAGEVVSMRTEGPGPCSVKTLLLGDAHLAALAHPVHSALIRDTVLSSGLSALFRELELRMRSIDVTRRIQALVERVAAERAPLEPVRPPFATPLTPVRDYLRAHPTTSTSVDDLERFSGLTRFHLARVFRREFGLPPRAYQMRQRLSLANRLLAMGTPASEVSYYCDFSDQSHLTRSFREAYGITPYRWSSTFLTAKRPAVVETRSISIHAVSRQSSNHGHREMKCAP
jgi:AraC-like DNA-binding protein